MTVTAMRSRLRLACQVVGCFVGLVLAVAIARADIITPSEYVMIMDYDTGKVLYEKNSDAPMKPASMAKLMTTYLAFKQIKEGSLKLDDKFIVSEKAYRKGGSRTFVEVGKQVSVSDLLRGVIVQSGNDAAIVIAEGLAGTEEAFAQEMTIQAGKLGMENTVFGNSTGWPDEVTMTTAHDLAILARSIIRDFPELYKIYSETSFTYNNIKQNNRNPLLYSLDYVDGLKTGHTNASGYGLTASAERDGMRIILVVNGLSSMKERRLESTRLMDLSFRLFQKYDLVKSDEVVVNAPVWLGEEESVPLSVEKTISAVLNRKTHANITRRMELPDTINAPVTKGQPLGEIILTIDGKDERFPLVATKDIAELPFHRRIGAFFKQLIFGVDAPAPVEGN
ncbi:MAG: D-alanyl-D-alanine carboxypeptidase [Alphaproteobacteria bacterium]|nr:D-alanyl-D-alanine carboxypeptidase [Alphaproteobacteria bacterium]